MTDANGRAEWLNEALFEVEASSSHKTDVDANLIQGEVLDRLAALNDRQRLSFVELVGTRGRERFLQAGEEVTGLPVPPGVQYIFSAAIREMIAAVVTATDGTDPTCHYCLTSVDPETENACKQATLWVSGAKWQNTRMRRYTGAWAHKECVEDRAEKPEVAQELLEF